MKKLILGTLALAAAIPAVPTAAVAQRYDRADRYAEDHNYNGYYDRYDARQDRREYRRAERRDDRRYARYYDRNGYYSGPTWRGNDGRYHCHRSDGTTGLLLGGVAGALVGRGIDSRGDRTTGTLLGAVAGALLGQAIDKDSNQRGRCR